MVVLRGRIVRGIVWILWRSLRGGGRTQHLPLAPRSRSRGHRALEALRSRELVSSLSEMSQSRRKSLAPSSGEPGREAGKGG